MTQVTRGDTHIHVYEGAEGATPIVLIHGFASDHVTNWVAPGWIAPLVDAGFRAIAPDLRGHGRSTKHYEPEAYALEEMAADVAVLIEGLDAGPVRVMGYSMGAFTSAVLAASRPELVSRLVLAGVGENMLRETGQRNEEIAQGLLRDDVPPPSQEVPRRFRLFADQTGADKKALAACIRGIGKVFTAEDLGAIAAPTLVIAGETDDVARDPAPLAALIPGADCVVVPRRDHMRAVGDKVTKAEVLGFLTAGR
ncbi:MAG: alpha/beta fold hydrolase [Candidatus Phaeomarinobacter sp.]